MTVRIIDLLTLIMDLTGLILISWYLFSIPKPVTFTFNQEYGIITSLQPVADAINKISGDIAVISKMRCGFYILVVSLLLKLGKWVMEYFLSPLPKL
ncbi:MAG: hypothetical protein ABSF48_20520 [Thermodesulfobacteriota bacterium]|jgi:hypothetical protein